MDPKAFVINYTGEVPKTLKISMFQNTYLRVEHTAPWLALGKSWISELVIPSNLADPDVENLKGDFTSEAWDVLKDRYTLNPRKWVSEAYKGSLMGYIDGVPVEAVEETTASGGLSFPWVCKFWGQPKLSKLLLAVPAKALFPLFIGAPASPPYFYRWTQGQTRPVGHNPELYLPSTLVSEVVNNRIMMLPTAAAMFNTWTSGLEKVTLKKGVSTFQYNATDLENLRDYLYS